jgi:S-adenosylmethionine synthetase
VACETLVKTGMAIIAGEITTTPGSTSRSWSADILDIGYDSSSEVGLRRRTPARC